VYAVLRGEDPTAAADAAARKGQVLVDVELMPLMPEFLSRAAQLAQQLASAAAAANAKWCGATAHKLAGSLAMYGFEERQPGQPGRGTRGRRGPGGAARQVRGW
jgi:hypothetical protein